MPAGSAAAETLHLWGGLARPSSHPSVGQPPPIEEQQQLTIFYSGVVNVYENVPAEKAHAILLLLAGHGSRGRSDDQSRSSTTHTKPTASGAPASPPTLVFSSAAHDQIIRKRKQLALHLGGQRSESELPFARKASLARFLEKRKDRVQAKQAGSSSQEELDVSQQGDQCKKIKLSTTESAFVSPPKAVHAPLLTPFLW